MLFFSIKLFVYKSQCSIFQPIFIYLGFCIEIQKIILRQNWISSLPEVHAGIPAEIPRKVLGGFFQTPKITTGVLHSIPREVISRIPSRTKIYNFIRGYVWGFP